MLAAKVASPVVIVFGALFVRRALTALLHVPRRGTSEARLANFGG